jgi:hypothetical protein
MAVYRWLDYLRRVSEGVPIVDTSTGDLYLDLVAAAAGESPRVSNPPVFTVDPATGERGMALRKCSRDYKVRAVERELRALGYGPRRPVQQWIGISWDESERVKVPADLPKWIELRWPLVEERITRRECIEWLREQGHPDPPKSACVFCPYHSDAYWRQMRAERPDEWKMELEVDGLVRSLPGLRGEGFLHAQRVPLVDAVLSPEDIGQLPMFDADDGAAECGGGCFL